MKKLVLLSLLAGCASSPTQNREQAPTFQLSGLDGKPIRAEDLWAGHPVLVVFMTSWCKACKAEVPLLNELARTHAVVAISTGDTREAAERCRDAAGITYPVLLDEGPVAKAYGVKASPTCILIDKGGAILYRGTKPPEDLK